jgi:hypothetical protein
MVDNHYGKQELEAQLARCRALAREFPDGPTARNLRDLARELEQKLRAVEA